MDAHGDAVAAFAFLADLDEPRQDHARSRIIQNRMGHDLGAQRSGRKSDRAGGKTERERKAAHAPPRQDRHRNTGKRQCDGRPPRRLAIRREIETMRNPYETASQGISRPGATSAIAHS